MKWMIRCDVEGATGVVNPEQSTPGKRLFEYACRMLQSDVEAASAAFLETGADEVLVYDMHYQGINLDMGRLHPRVRVVCGKPSYCVGDVGGLDASFAGVALVGLHAMADSGTVRAHSYEHAIREIRLNDTVVGERGVEAALAGDMGIPVALVTEDSTGAAEARTLLPWVETAVVKESMGPTSALCLSIEGSAPHP